MISREEMMNIASLSKLYLGEEDFKTASKEMDSIIKFVNQIDALDAKVKDDKQTMSNLSNAFHEDEIMPSFPNEEILKNADGGKDGFFYVKKFA